ncbi:hypothetical protein [uncultured Pseudomonas sp.]|uniref:hypothetical protein n=1 Tax=uncultured Pseudomonas sp. TaxID=114707 RepID=UPI0026013F49|nr:hypothetical protein [uncultured Pseudomonas sp.]
MSPIPNVLKVKAPWWRAKGVFSLGLQVLLACLMCVALALFLTGKPASALSVLWGNIYEVRNAATIVVVLTLVALFGTLRPHPINAVVAVLAAFVLMAGPVATLWALTASFVAAALGYQLIGREARAQLARSDVARIALAFWVGKAMFLLILAVLSFFPINTRFMEGALMGALLLLSPIGRDEVVRVLRELFVSGPRELKAVGGWKVPRFFLLLSVMLLIVASVHPGFDGDAMTMHMRIAREMQSKGMWGYDFREYVFAVMPLAPQLNFSAMFIAGNIEAVKVELVLQFLVMLALVATGGGFRLRPTGVAVASVLALVPMFVREISGLFIEVTLCGFILASAVLLTSSLRHRSIELALLAALCAAGASATKTFGLVLAPVILAVLVVNWREIGKTTDRLRLSMILLAAVVLALFFYVVAWLKTGNPLFPFFNGVFKSPYWDPVNFLDRRWAGHLEWDLPWKMTFESSRYEESSDGSMGLMILFLLACAGSLVAVCRRNLLALVPFGVGVIYLVAVGVQIQYLRYFLPGMALLATSIAYYMHIVVRRPQNAMWMIILGCLFVANLFGLPASRFVNGMMHIPAMNMVSPSPYRGVQSANYAEEMLNAHQYMGNILAASVRKTPTVLLLGCPYGAYFNGRTIYTTWHNYSWASRQAQLLDTAQFERYLAENEVSHIVLDGCTKPEVRAALAPYIHQHFRRMAELWGVEMYEVTK